VYDRIGNSTIYTNQEIALAESQTALWRMFTKLFKF
jgi:hypothetical protein